MTRRLADILEAEPVPEAGQLRTASLQLEWTVDGEGLVGRFESLQVSASPDGTQPPVLYVELVTPDGERVRLEAEVEKRDVLDDLPVLAAWGERVPLESLLALISTLRALDVRVRRAVAGANQRSEAPLVSRDGECVLEPAEADGRWGFVHPNDRDTFVIKPRYDAARPFVENRAAVSRDGCWGLVDPLGTEIVEVEYDDVRNCNDGLIVVCRDGQCGLVDDIGAVLVEPRWEDIGEQSEGMVAVQRHERWGYVEIADDELVIDTWLLEAGPFEQGRAAVEIDQGWTTIDRNGNVASIESQDDELGSPAVYRSWRETLARLLLGIAIAGTLVMIGVVAWVVTHPEDNASRTSLSDPPSRGTREDPFRARHRPGLGNPRIEIHNQADRSLWIVFDGPEHVEIEITPGEIERLRLEPGVYHYETTAERTRPLKGDAPFEKDFVYGWAFVIEQAPVGADVEAPTEIEWQRQRQ